MKKLFTIFPMSLLAIILTASSAFSHTEKHHAADHHSLIKKGLGLAESKGWGLEQINLLQLGWYYNWGASSKLESKTEFIPMAFSLNSLAKMQDSQIILGFNEPDNAKQSNLSVADAVKNWPLITARARRVGSPAIAGNPLKDHNWLADFMQQESHVNFITVHWYKGCDSKKFIADISQIIKKYKLPVWITEFAPQTVAESKKNPEKYTQLEVAKFIQETTAWMAGEPGVERYAWHDSTVGSSAIFTEKGELTETGKDYRDAGN